jgi:acyl carrier protein
MIREDLKSVILEILHLEDWDIKDETRAYEVPGWDSLNHINIILGVEKHFSVRFENTELFKLKNIGDLQRLLDAKLKRGEPGGK